jgi:hypothetical protein
MNKGQSTFPCERDTVDPAAITGMVMASLIVKKCQPLWLTW